MHLPPPRGSLSTALRGLLRANPDRSATDDPTSESLAQQFVDAFDSMSTTDVLRDDDVQLTLFMLYELHYRGFDDVDERWEWDPRLAGVRSDLEAQFEAALRGLVPTDPPDVHSAREVACTLFELARNAPGPSVSRFIARSASRAQLEELLIHKSVYQLKEADPHTWAIPRLTGAPKAALVEIQADEYGGGLPKRMHAELFAATMAGVGLDARFGAYLTHVPALTLAAVNAMSLFGLHRRLRGAAVGHLTILEMTSSLPNRQYARGLHRLGYPAEVVDYFHEHVEADAVHEQIAGHDLAGRLVETEADQWAQVFFGAQCVLELDRLVAEHQLAAWEQGETSLRHPLPAFSEEGVA